MAELPFLQSNKKTASSSTFRHNQLNRPHAEKNASRNHGERAFATDGEPTTLELIRSTCEYLVAAPGVAASIYIESHTVNRGCHAQKD